ncbi:phage tail protein [Embleya sp. NPDC050154]|uniref:phage tail protein n=1 Tax=Embleya sp. NPDC050154 TaxID=3363988 RepID=UPI0037AEA2F4
MSTGDIQDPFVNFNFKVELDGIIRVGFHEVSGLDATVDVVEHREGGWNITPYKFPGQAKYANIVLKWGMTIDTELYEWHQQIVEGDILRRNGAVLLLDRRGVVTSRWNFVRAWPTKYTAPALTAEADDIAIETLELVHEGLVRVQ